MILFTNNGYVLKSKIEILPKTSKQNNVRNNWCGGGGCPGRLSSAAGVSKAGLCSGRGATVVPEAVGLSLMSSSLGTCWGSFGPTRDPRGLGEEQLVIELRR